MQGRISDITKRIDDRRSVHPERNEDTEEIRQVAVFGGKRRNNESEAQRQALDHKDEHREEKQIPVRMQRYPAEDKEQIDDNKRTELQRETEHLGYHHRDGRHQSREIDLAKQAGIGLEGIGYRRKTLREILPEADTGEIKDRLRYIVRRYLSNPTEDHDIHKHREERRDEIPAHAKNRLLELNRYITLNKEPDQVALLP